MEDLQKKLEAELTLLKTVQKEYQKSISTRQQLETQLNENQLVKSELDLLPSDRKVYKAVGPALIKTDIAEAKQNVAKRMNFITTELKHCDDGLIKLEKKQDGHRENLHKLQQQFQQAKMKVAMKA